jgi:hypothetical protein
MNNEKELLPTHELQFSNFSNHKAIFTVNEVMYVLNRCLQFGIVERSVVRLA